MKLVVYPNIGDIFEIQVIGFPVGGIACDVNLVAIHQRNVMLQVDQFIIEGVITAVFEGVVLDLQIFHSQSKDGAVADVLEGVADDPDISVGAGGGVGDAFFVTALQDDGTDVIPVDAGGAFFNVVVPNQNIVTGTHFIPVGHIRGQQEGAHGHAVDVAIFDNGIVGLDQEGSGPGVPDGAAVNVGGGVVFRVGQNVAFFHRTADHFVMHGGFFPGDDPDFTQLGYGFLIVNINQVTGVDPTGIHGEFHGLNLLAGLLMGCGVLDGNHPDGVEVQLPGIMVNGGDHTGLAVDIQSVVAQILKVAVLHDKLTGDTGYVDTVCIGSHDSLGVLGQTDIKPGEGKVAAPGHDDEDAARCGSDLNILDFTAIHTGKTGYMGTIPNMPDIDQKTNVKLGKVRSNFLGIKAEGAVTHVSMLHHVVGDETVIGGILRIYGVDGFQPFVAGDVEFIVELNLKPALFLVDSGYFAGDVGGNVHIKGKVLQGQIGAVHKAKGTLQTFHIGVAEVHPNGGTILTPESQILFTGDGNTFTQKIDTCWKQNFAIIAIFGAELGQRFAAALGFGRDNAIVSDANGFHKGTSVF